jgi:hypothetical protein
MAYLNFSTDELHPLGVPQQTIAPSRRGLSPTEREAVKLARLDRLGSLKPAGRLHRMSQAVFGLSRRSNWLADPRLEGLRRFGVAVAHGGSAAVEREEAHLKMLGFSEAQVAGAAALASSFRPRRSSGGMGIYASLSATTVGIFVWIDRYLGDPQVSLIVAMVLALPVWAIAAPRS